MNPVPYDFEFLTPCFYRGDDPAKAELRASSIRGALRWWFRALGGTQEQEEQIFGTVRDKAKASSVVIRVEALEPPAESEELQDGNPHMWKFIPRKALLPGTKAAVYVLLRPLFDDASEKAQDLWRLAFEAFCRFGSIGYRATRAAGAFRVKQFSGGLEDYRCTAETILKPAGFAFRFFESDLKARWRDTVGLADQKLWKYRKKIREKLAQEGRPLESSPLGRAKGARQTSAVYFRPLKITDNEYCLVVFEAPQERVVAKENRLSWTDSVLRWCE